MERITSRHNPLCQHIRKLGRDRKYRRSQGQFLAEGDKLAAEALRWGACVDVVILTEGTPPPKELPAGVRLAEVPPALMEALSTVDSPQHMLAVCAVPPTALPEGVLGGVLVLDGVQDPGNVGTIWRTADAFGAAGLFLVNGCADPFSPKTVRSTMGACFRLPVWEGELDQAAALLRAGGVSLYAAALGEETWDIRDLDLTAAAVIIGSEGRGVSSQGLALSEKTVKIPMTDRCESLNAAAAAAVVLWEMARGRLSPGNG